MFLAGPEIEFSEFRKNSFRGIFFGLSNFALPFLLGYFAGIYLLSLNIIPSFPIVILLASNPLIAYPSVNKPGITKAPAVVTAVSGTVIADTLVLIVLALGRKWLAAWLTRIIFRQTRTEMNIVFGLTTARTAATLAIVKDDNVLNIYPRQYV
ncbi:MAG TPA: hypothetical protein ENH59_04625 [Bacteroidetes bacterium]|nr:hypothetical protein [Bacteroidota bacterium]